MRADVIELDREETALILTGPIPADRHPVFVYLARLNTSSSRRTMRCCLDNTCAGAGIAGLASGGQATAVELDWSRWKYQHTVAVRSALLDDYAPATVNKHLSALRGVLEAAWRLRYIPSTSSGHRSAEDYQRATRVKGVRSKTLPAGRHITKGEITARWARASMTPGPRERGMQPSLRPAQDRHRHAVQRRPAPLGTGHAGPGALRRRGVESNRPRRQGAQGPHHLRRARCRRRYRRLAVLPG